MCEEDVSLYGQYGECRFLRVLEAGEGNNTADAALALCEFPGETADNAALVAQLVNFAAQALRVDRLIRLAGQLDMHGLLVLLPLLDLIEVFGVTLHEDLVAGFSLHRLPITDLCVHRMVGGAAIDADPLDFHIADPLYKVH